MNRILRRMRLVHSVFCVAVQCARALQNKATKKTAPLLKINKDKTLPDVRLPVVSDDFQPTHVVVRAPNKKV